MNRQAFTGYFKAVQYFSIHNVMSMRPICAASSSSGVNPVEQSGSEQKKTTKKTFSGETQRLLRFQKNAHSDRRDSLVSL